MQNAEIIAFPNAIYSIVAKVDALFAMCDTLKQRLSEARTIQNQMAGMVQSKPMSGNCPMTGRNTDKIVARLACGGMNKLDFHSVHHYLSNTKFLKVKAQCYSKLMNAVPVNLITKHLRH
jgi:hypothetical protein